MFLKYTDKFCRPIKGIFHDVLPCYSVGIEKGLKTLRKDKFFGALLIRVNRGIKEYPSFKVLKHTTMPAVLVETAFISNMEDAKN